MTPIGSQRLTRSGVVVMLVLALVSGCSGDSGGSADDESAATSESTVPETTVPVFSGQPDSRYCELSRVLLASPEDKSPEQLAAHYAGIDALAAELVSAAPSVIEADIGVFLAGIQALGDAMEAVGFVPSNVDDADRPETKDPDFPTAANRVVEFNQQVCIAADTPPPGETTTDEGSVPDVETPPDSEAGAGEGSSDPRPPTDSAE